MTLFEALRPVVPHNQTDDQLNKMISEGVIVNTGDPIKDPNHIVHEGDKLRVGFITWMAHDIARRKAEVDDAFTGEEEEQSRKQNLMSKTRQAEGLDARRPGAKYRK